MLDGVPRTVVVPTVLLYSVVTIERNRTAFFSHVGLSPAGTVVVIHRRGLVYDGRFAPVSRSSSRARTVLFLVLEGFIHPSNSPRAASGPTAWVIAEDDIEGADGVRVHTLRTWGEPHVSVTLHVRAEDCGVPLERGQPPREIPIPPDVLEAARRYAECVRNQPSREACDRDVRVLLEAATAAGWIRRDARAWLDVPVASHALRMWSALSTFYTRMELSPTVIQLSDLVQLSARHVDRILKRWVSDYGLPLEGWRDLTRRWRLKAAVLLLSSPDFRVGEVARLVGYSNAEALTNALAAEGLPSPIQYRTLFEDVA